MSTIAGMVRFDGTPVDEDSLRRIASRMQARGHDPAIAALGDCALIGGRADNIAIDDAWAIAFDGRLDNRDELLPQLELNPDSSDAAIVLAAFRKWGADVAEHLDGDYAIGAVNRRDRQLVCIRDRFGIRTLFYRMAPEWCAFGSSIDLLTAGLAPMPAINEGMAGEYLSSFTVSIRDTLFEDVFRVAPAERVVAGPGRLGHGIYWTPSPRPLQRASDRELEEALRELLRAAVRRRLRAAPAVGVMLSGGLDSSAVTGLAAEAIRERVVSTERLETFSGSVPGPDDERAFADAVSARWGAAAHVVMEQQPSPGQFAAEIALDLEPQMFPHSPTIDMLRAKARERGIRVMLTGNGADDWFGSGPMAYADLLARGRLIALVSRIRQDVDSDLFAGWRLALQTTVWPLLPEAARRAARVVFARGRPPAWIDPAFAKRIALADRLAQFRSQRRFATRELDDNWFQAMHGVHLHAAEIVTRGGNRFGLELAHPFFDRQLVEFALTLPPEQLWRHGRAKDLLRRTMQSHVPNTVTARRTSPSADHAFIHAIASAAGDAPFANLESVSRGWIVQGPVAEMWNALRERHERAAHEGRILWGIQAVDLWLAGRTMVKYTSDPRRTTCV